MCTAWAQAKADERRAKNSFVRSPGSVNVLPDAAAALAGPRGRAVSLGTTAITTNNADSTLVVSASLTIRSTTRSSEYGLVCIVFGAQHRPLIHRHHEVKRGDEQAEFESPSPGRHSAPAQCE